MGFTKALVVLWALWLSTRVYGQPVGCTEDSQCPVGHYCELTTLYCQKCLSCEDYKRESPLQRDLCVKSVVQCGNCSKGLVENVRMDHACAPLRTDPGEVRPTYVWAIIGLVVVGLTLFGIIYIVFKKDTLFQYILKIRATTSVHSTCGSANGASPSAPELGPPPYDELYTSYAASAAPAPPAQATRTAAEGGDDDASRPFIKRVPSERARGARESADSQAARPYNYPAYVRGPQTSYIQSDESEPVSAPFTPHDEDTMESLWTPNENLNNIISNPNGNGVSEGTAAPLAPAAAPRARPAGDEGPPAKALCVREDTNNNRGRESSGAGAGARAGAGAGAGAEAGADAGAAHAPTVVISVVNNFNSFEQRNNLNLPRH